MKKKIIPILILMLAFIAMGFSGCTKPITYNIIGKEKVYGYTDTMKLVNVVAKEDSIGKIVPVLITAAKSFSLDGKINE